LEDPHVNVS
jgi:hypothetical protein